MTAKRRLSGRFGPFPEAGDLAQLAARLLDLGKSRLSDGSDDRVREKERENAAKKEAYDDRRIHEIDGREPDQAGVSGEERQDGESARARYERLPDRSRRVAGQMKTGRVLPARRAVAPVSRTTPLALSTMGPKADTVRVPGTVASIPTAAIPIP